MRLIRCVVPVLLGVAVALAASGTLAATVYLQEDFNSYAEDNSFMYYGMWNEDPIDMWIGWHGEIRPDVDYQTYLGMWKRVEIPAAGRDYPYELLTPWTLNTSTKNPNDRPSPGTLDGTSSTGQFLMSDSKTGGHGYNDTGESYDIWTPAFSTVGASEVWLHCATAAVTNDNYGHSVFFVDVTTDEGATWDTQWIRISPERSALGGYDPPAVSYVPELGVNASGYYGQLDVELSSAAGHENVMVRFRHYEPSSDYFFAIDDVVVDDVAPTRPLGTVVFQENFDNGLGGMSTSGLKTGVNTWNTNAPVDIWDPEADVLALNTDEHSIDDAVTMIEYPCEPTDTPDFALVVWAGATGAYDEWMMTPLLDLSDATAAVVSYEDECLPDKPRYEIDPVTGEATDVILEEDGNQRVYLMYDSNGNGIADAGDEILKVLFDYESPYENENPYYALRSFDISDAAGRDDCFVAWRNDGPLNLDWGQGQQRWWAIDTIEVTATMVPEPSTVALLLGGLLMAWIGRRRR